MRRISNPPHFFAVGYFFTTLHAVFFQKNVERDVDVLVWVFFEYQLFEDLENSLSALLFRSLGNEAVYRTFFKALFVFFDKVVAYDADAFFEAERFDVVGYFVAERC